MTSDSLRTLTITRKFEQSADRVFDAWLDPGVAGKWLFATPDGQMIRAEIDPRVGGNFNFTERRGGEDVEHVGTYLEIDRPRKLAFFFSVPKYFSSGTRVAIDIRPLAIGCELTLTHEGVLSDWAERTEEGWGKILAKLAATLA